jgi:hypothetical protein
LNGIKQAHHAILLLAAFKAGNVLMKSDLLADKRKKTLRPCYWVES